MSLASSKPLTLVWVFTRLSVLRACTFSGVCSTALSFLTRASPKPPRGGTPAVSIQFLPPFARRLCDPPDEFHPVHIDFLGAVDCSEKINMSRDGRLCLLHEVPCAQGVHHLLVVTVLIHTSCALLHHTAPAWFHRAWFHSLVLQARVVPRNVGNETSIAGTLGHGTKIRYISFPDVHN
eukprot:SAG11_NODE_6650_length_1274_cov_1.073191_1_plen_178_part_10